MWRSLPISIALRYVGMGRRSQLVSFMSLLTIAGLSLSIAILITVLSVMNGFDREMRENILGILPHITVHTTEHGWPEQWQLVEQVLDGHPQVIGRSPMVETIGVVSTANTSRGVLVNGMDTERDDNLQSMARFMREGSLDALTAQRFTVVIGESLANELDVGVGDTLRLFSLGLSVNPVSVLPNQRQFTVAGIYRVGTQELDSALALIRLDDARALFRVRGSHTALRLQTNDLLAANSLARDITRDLPSGFYLETWTRQFGAIYENILLSRTIVGLLLWLLVAVAAFNLVVSLVMIVRDKRGDIAILRTMGATPGTIGRIFLLQGCMVGMIGTVIGLALGTVLSLTASDIVSWIEGLSGTEMLSADVYPVDFLPSQLLFSDVAVVIAGVFVLCLLASVYPAWRASRVQPAAALRME